MANIIYRTWVPPMALGKDYHYKLNQANSLKLEIKQYSKLEPTKHISAKLKWLWSAKKYIPMHA